MHIMHFLIGMPAEGAERVEKWAVLVVFPLWLSMSPRPAVQKPKPHHPVCSSLSTLRAALAGRECIKAAVET